ncbi:MAG: flagellar protein FlgN [Desulfitobacteriaceae bacterium]
MLESTLRQLEENLKQQLELYDQLWEIAMLKQRALVGNLIKELDVLITREEIAVLQTTRLEKERVDLVAKVAGSLGIPAEEVILSKLATIHAPFSVLQKDIESVIADIRRQNTLNTELLVQAKRIMDFSFRILTQSKESTYLPDGKRIEQRKPKADAFIFDKSV